MNGKCPTRANSHGIIAERLSLSRIELFRHVAEMTPTVAVYWLEAIERMLNNMQCTLE